MLQKLGEQVQGWIAGIIVVIIAIVFVSFGMAFYLQGHSGGHSVVANVNGQELTKQELDMHYNQAVRANPTLAMADPTAQRQFKQTLVNQWVKLQAMHTSLQQAGMLVSPAVVSQFIQKLPMLQVNGVFSPYLLQAFMQQRGFTNEEQLYQFFTTQMTTPTFIAAINESTLLLPDTISRYAMLTQQRRSFRYHMLPIDHYIGSVKVSSNQLKAYYNSHLAEYKAPETVSIDYVKLSPGDLANQIQLTDASVQQYYQQHLATFTHPKTWKVVTFSMSDLRSMYVHESNKALQQRFQQQVADLQAGRGVAKFLAQFKPVTYTATSLPPQVQSLKPGQVSSVQNDNPLKGKLVYYVVAETAKHVQPLSAVKQLISDKLRKQQESQLFAQKVDLMTNQAISNPESLAAVAKAAGLSVKTTKAFTRKGLPSGLAASTRVVTAAYGGFSIAARR